MNSRLVADGFGHRLTIGADEHAPAVGHPDCANPHLPERTAILPHIFPDQPAITILRRLFLHAMELLREVD